jgi:hypothetical protein
LPSFDRPARGRLVPPARRERRGTGHLAEAERLIGAASPPALRAEAAEARGWLVYGQAFDGASRSRSGSAWASAWARWPGSITRGERFGEPAAATAAREALASWGCAPA